ncbi:quinone oxidoreductase [Phyllobacterium sp. P30BS-XVII]|uniref:quinone oxidoreductase family protein n=1 Tax=Phyllobacterium sp. P30BS-XVII TaxID=2587046 RepID=UPI000DDA2114|nr:quinone oxidoreductase [Phyllobacterium sp. P30BS-XVII]MBA8900523.1 NADPH2:quinone reductase [Phyllobacterium sp. P30BS-XVII]
MSLIVEMNGHGGPEVLHTRDIKVADPGPNEVRIRQTAIGVNFVDIYFRTGLYSPPSLPAVLGFEGAGTVDAVGDDVTNLKPGDRVGYTGMPLGGYAEVRLLPQSRLIKLPDAVSNRVAASTFLRGLTAYMLLHEVRAIKRDEWILVHAAAGGVGQLVTRWAKRLGAHVIGTVGSEGKAVMAKAAGADEVLFHKSPDWAERARQIADGKGVHLAIDGIGGSTFTQTLKTLRPFGILASIGQPAGPVSPIRIEDLGNIAVMRPSIIASVNNPEFYERSSRALISALQDGLQSPIGTEYALHDAAKAQADLEAGKTTGSVILTI